jgi:hypothetical protein
LVNVHDVINSTNNYGRERKKEETGVPKVAASTGNRNPTMATFVMLSF